MLLDKDFVATEIAPRTKEKQEVIKTGVWRCPICTYDNEDSMSECEICGVLRNPLVKFSGNGDSAAANFKRLLSLDMPSPEKEKNILIESELAAKGPDSSSASMARDEHGGVKDRDSASDSGSKPEILISSMRSVSLSSKARTENVNEEMDISNMQYKPESWMMADQAEDRLSQLNLAIVGHVDSGKSTLSGRLLHLLGRISKKEMHKYEKEAKQQGKGSFSYAWALDESAEERERGITMTVAVAFFNSRKYHVVLLDSPGHRDFVPNMISGATQADAAILVVDASMGSFEAGLDAIGGQTREHTQLIRSFGVDQLIVVVNKMDIVEYSQERFDMVKKKLGTFLRSCGYKDSSVSWIPVSAMENQNLVATSDDKRLLSCAHLRTSEIIELRVSACGKLETGAIRTGSKVLVMPSREIATVRSMERDSQVCNIARAGDNITVNLQGIESNLVTAGGVLCHPDFPVRVANHLELKILVLDVTIPILIGSQLELHIHHVKEAARVVKILSLLDPKTGKVMKKAPRCILSKQNAVIEVVLHGLVCVDEYAKSRALGRVSLRSSGRTIALGLVTQILKRQE
ncbi:Translation elongation factor EF1A/initiation factor IF2 gamma family protein [Abeliophyllum distichum]|uniref:Translation elongation factor EF1A/initiation factor IF2 gamma family protein n=1 Tax=Abeliophyllum distichum TaxID=126358 RepID=A0ABD1TK28_9LAMI